MAGEEDLVAFHVADVYVRKGYVEFLQRSFCRGVGALVLDARVDEEDVSFFYRVPFSAQHKVALTGKDQGYFYEVVTVKVFRFFPGYLAGEEERGIQVFVGYVVLYLAHGWCINSLGVDWCGGA